MRSSCDKTPLQLFAYIYDVPKQMTVTQLTTAFTDELIECEVQIVKQPKKPFDSAMVKFQNSVHLQVACEKLRHFSVNGCEMRLLPYDPLLTSNKQRSASKKDSALSSVCLEDKENENLPDNSNLQCNLCVTNLDPTLLAADLHQIFQMFGEIKSTKVASDPVTKKSKCYGYVWFQTEESCSQALKASENLPYPV